MPDKNPPESGNRETLTLVEPADPAVPAENEPTRNALIDGYRAIIRAGAIRYPVAYEFQHELGRGRQGRVFLALRRGARGSVTRHAIKIFDPGIYASGHQYWTDMGRIATQISSLQSSHNPNLLSRDAYEEINGVGYVQMEAIDGVDLHYLLRGGHIDSVLKKRISDGALSFADSLFLRRTGATAIQPGAATYIMRQILRGVEALHDKGFVHSDIKPSNVMIDRLGYVRVIDHGRAVKDGEKVRMLLGSPIYMAPEVHARRPSVTQSDLYSVGLVGLEMLRGEPLVEDPDTSEADLMKFKESLPEVLEDMLPKEVRENQTLVDILKNLLQPDPGARFARAAQAESGNWSLATVHRQMTQVGKDSEYGREIEDYVAHLVDPETDRVTRI
jgi:serine/threonine protein kinase